MPESSPLLDIWSRSRDAIAQAEAPDGLFPDARFNDIGHDPSLTQYLRAIFGLEAPASIDQLKSAVLDYAEQVRGKGVWTVIGVPATMPSSVGEHQRFNLIERLYITSKYRSGQTPYFGRDMMTEQQRTGRLLAVQFAGGGLTVTGLFCIVWFMRRRSKAAKREL